MSPSQMISILGRHAERQARDGALVHVEQPRHRGLWLALVEQLESLLLLMPRQLRRPAEADARFTRPLDAHVGARFDQAALELGEAAQDGEHQPAVRRGRVGIGRAST